MYNNTLQAHILKITMNTRPVVKQNLSSVYFSHGITLLWRIKWFCITWHWAESRVHGKRFASFNEIFHGFQAFVHLYKFLLIMLQFFFLLIKLKLVFRCHVLIENNIYNSFWLVIKLTLAKLAFKESISDIRSRFLAVNLPAWIFKLVFLKSSSCWHRESCSFNLQIVYNF